MPKHPFPKIYPMSVPIYGLCETTFLKVKQAFINNFAEEGELGAAVTIFIDGEKVIDLWGGFTDKAPNTSNH